MQDDPGSPPLNIGKPPLIFGDLVEGSSRKRAPDILHAKYLISRLSKIEHDRQSTSNMVTPTAQQYFVTNWKTHAGIPIGLPEVEYDLP